MGGDKQPEPWAQGGGRVMWVARRVEMRVWEGGHYSPGNPGLRSQKGFQCRPSRPDPPGQSQRDPCPGCTTQPAGPQLLNFSVGPWNPGLASPLPVPAPLPGLGGGHSPCPGLPGAPARSLSSASPPPSQGRGQGPCSTPRRCGSVWRGPAALPPDPGWHLWTRAAQGLGPTSPFDPRFSLIVLAWLWEEKPGNIKACH